VKELWSSLEGILSTANATTIRFVLQSLIAIAVAASTWILTHVSGEVDKVIGSIDMMRLSLISLEDTVKSDNAQNDLRFSTLTSRTSALETKIDILEGRVRALEIRQGSLQLTPGSRIEITPNGERR
jgi:hypothetical protein